MINERGFSVLVNSGKEAIFVENEDHNLIAYRWEGGHEIHLKLANKEDILAVRDLLNEAYPIYGKSNDAKGKTYHLHHALEKLVKLQEETTNLTIGNAMEAAGWFFKRDFQGVIDDIKTALILVQKENDHVGERDQALI